MARCGSDAQSVVAKKSDGFERSARSVYFGIIRLLRAASHDENSIACGESYRGARGRVDISWRSRCHTGWPPKTELAAVTVEDAVSARALVTVTGGLVHILPADEQWPVQNTKSILKNG
jgi:hypothetical protein